MNSPVRALRGLIEPGFIRRLAPLALPIAFQNLLTSTFAAVDTVMVGQLGDTAIAAVGAAAQIAFFINMIMFGVASGGAVFISQYWGAGDHRRIHNAHGLMLLATVPTAIVFSLIVLFFPRQMISMFTKDPAMIELGIRYLRFACFSYIGGAFNQVWAAVLRCTEETRIPMFANIAGVLVNVSCNYIFIFGKFGMPQMGVAGAALATTLSAFVTPLVMLLWSLKKRNMLGTGFSQLFTFDRAFAKTYAVRSLPVLLNESIWGIGYTAYNMVFGHMGTDNYAALTITRTIENIVFAFFVGICNATNVIVGKSVGAGEYEEAKKHARSCMALYTTVSLCLGAIMIFLRDPILTFFSISDTVRATTRIMLLIYCIELVLRNTPYILVVGIFRGGGDTKTGLKLDLYCLYFITLPLVFITGMLLKWPFLVVYVLMLLVEDGLKSIIGLRYYRSMRWIQSVVEKH